jgi:hypothetical protein
MNCCRKGPERPILHAKRAQLYPVNSNNKRRDNNEHTDSPCAAAFWKQTAKAIDTNLLAACHPSTALKAQQLLALRGAQA